MPAETIERDYAERIARLSGGAVPQDRPGAFIQAVEDLLACFEDDLERDSAANAESEEEDRLRILG